MTFGDYHVHTCLCDGADSPRQMAARAAELGMEAIGFSGHAPMPFETGWCMTNTEDYRKQIAQAAAEFQGRLTVLTGVEQDILSGPVPRWADYAIGSVHFLSSGGRNRPLDESRAESEALLADFGDGGGAGEAYFRQVRRLPEIGAQIVGHFDLITRFDETGGPALFDPDDPRYRAAATDALDALLKKGMIFEINAGAMVRGGRTAPYPARPWLEYIRARGGRILLSGDCHSAATLGRGVALARDAALACGFRETWVPVGGGKFEPRAL